MGSQEEAGAGGTGGAGGAGFGRRRVPGGGEQSSPGGASQRPDRTRTPRGRRGGRRREPQETGWTDSTPRPRSPLDPSPSLQPLGKVTSDWRTGMRWGRAGRWSRYSSSQNPRAASPPGGTDAQVWGPLRSTRFVQPRKNKNKNKGAGRLPRPGLRSSAGGGGLCTGAHPWSRARTLASSAPPARFSFILTVL